MRISAGSGCRNVLTRYTGEPRFPWELALWSLIVPPSVLHEVEQGNSLGRIGGDAPARVSGG